MRLLYILILGSIINVISFSQELTPEQKIEIIGNLDSTNYFIREKAVYDILRYNIPEAVPKLEEKIFQQEQEIAVNYLRALSKYNSPNIISFAHGLIDSIDFLTYRYVKNDSLLYKVEATRILFQHGDYSTAGYIFDLIEKEKPNISLQAFNLLDDVINNIPQYENQAKTELIRILENNKLYINGSINYNALSMLVKKYEGEMIPLLIDISRNNESETTRRLALNSLYQLDYSDLNNLLRERFFVDTSLAIDIADDLLYKFGTPSEYKFIKDNVYSLGDNFDIEFLIEVTLDDFTPPNDTLSTVEVKIDNLLSLIDTITTYAWLGDNFFSNEIRSTLQSAKTNFQNGDSLNCARDVKLFQDNVDEVYKDSLNTDPRFVTLEGWKFLYWNAQYILDRLPETTTESEISTYSIFAMHSLWLEQNSDILSGNIGVNEAGNPPFLDSQVELSVGNGVTTSAGYSVKANRIKVKQNVTVNGDIYYNELDNNGTITGSQNTPLELPLLALLSEFKTSTPGTQNIVVPQNSQQTLHPGNYGDIQVKLNGKLIFTGGEYHINNFTAGDNNQVVFQSPSEIKIAGKFDSGQGSYIGPEDTTSVSAKDIIFYVGGINGTNGNLGATPKAAKIGIDNLVKANFYVPNGTLWIRQNSEVEGAFIGKDVDAGIGVKVWLKSAF